MNASCWKILAATLSMAFIWSCGGSDNSSLFKGGGGDVGTGGSGATSAGNGGSPTGGTSGNPSGGTGGVGGGSGNGGSGGTSTGGNTGTGGVGGTNSGGSPSGGSGGIGGSSYGGYGGSSYGGYGGSSYGGYGGSSYGGYGGSSYGGYGGSSYGGSGGGCSNWTDPCGSCLDASCCPQVKACLGQSVCYDCITNPNASPPACEADSTTMAFAQCAFAYCDTQCGGAGSAGASGAGGGNPSSCDDAHYQACASNGVNCCICSGQQQCYGAACSQAGCY
jgi:hypothetical protein